MKNKVTIPLYKFILVLVILVFFTPTNLFAQTISNVKNGSNILPLIPSPGGFVAFRCYNPTLGALNFYCDFSVSSVVAGTTYTLQFSDEFGNFPTTPIVLNTAQPTFSGTTGTFTFLLPAGTSGNAYRLRVINSANSSSAFSPGIPCYYIPFTGTFYLLNNRVQNVSICGGGSFNLFVDPTIPSPATYPGLKYKWVKDGAPFPGTGSSINITQSGVYYAYIDYGICNTVTLPLKPPTSSLDVTVNIVPGGSSFTITGNPIICPPTNNTLSVTAGYVYQWFKNGVAISGATAFSYDAPQPGDYTVLVNQGTCSSTSNVFKLSAVGFTASIDVSELPDINIIGTGETKSITITSSAASPTYQWFLFDGTNFVLIPTATTATYNAAAAGKYKAIVNQTVGCLVSDEFLFELKEGVNPKEIPNLISPNNDTKNDTWILPQEYINLNTEIQIISATGQTVLQTTNYQNNWPITEIDFKTVNPVYYYIITKDGSQVKKGSITIIK